LAVRSLSWATLKAFSASTASSCSLGSASSNSFWSRSFMLWTLCASAKKNSPSLSLAFLASRFLLARVECLVAGGWAFCNGT